MFEMTDGDCISNRYTWLTMVCHIDIVLMASIRSTKKIQRKDTTALLSTQALTLTKE